MRPLWFARILCSLAIATIVLTGCSSDRRLPTAAHSPNMDSRDSRIGGSGLDSRSDEREDFFPLRVGNRWQYESTFRKVFVPRQGDPFSKQGRSTRQATIVDSEVIDGYLYFKEDNAVQDTFHGVPVFHTVRWLRQDRSGLFERGVSPPSPVGTDPSAVLERALLAYPIHPGARWVISPVPLITTEVKHLEMLKTPVGSFPGWRIRIRDNTHKGEVANVWYGHAGYLGMKSHSVSGAPGSDLMITYDQTEWLTAIHLVHGKRYGAVIDEAKESLGALLTGEQVYFQRFGTYTEIADSGEARVKLGVYLGGPSERWGFSVSDVSMIGFVARAQGRDNTVAEGIVLAFRYVRGQPLEWTVDDRRRDRNRHG